MVILYGLLDILLVYIFGGGVRQLYLLADLGNFTG